LKPEELPVGSDGHVKLETVHQHDFSILHDGEVVLRCACGHSPLSADPEAWGLPRTP
jgi:hypothetical protein